MKTYPFYTAVTTCQNLYDVSFDPIDYEEIAYIAWQKIGNKPCRIYKYEVCLNGEDSITLPDNCDIVDAVSNNRVESQDTDNTQRFNYIPQWIENYVESRNSYNKSPLYVKGKLLKGWTEENGELRFDTPIYGDVTILYKGILVDEDTGLPRLNQLELEAIACYCAMIYHVKKGYTGKDKFHIELSNMLRQEWTKLVTRARNPVRLSQNDLNTILDAKSSWNRHKHNLSTHFYK